MFLYIFRNIINKKIYVGQTKNIKSRPNSHFHTKNLIGNSLRKYGKENFELFVYSGIPDNLIDYFEIELIKKLNSLSPYGYNVDMGGNRNKKHTKETIKKILKNRVYKRGKYSPNYGKNLTEEHKRKIGNANKGKKIAEKTKIKLSEVTKKRFENKDERKKLSYSHRGKILSEEHKRKISEAIKGKKHTIETRKKMSKNSHHKKGKDSPNYGKKHSEETKRKMSKAHKKRFENEEERKKISNFQKGRKHSEETKKKISEARLKYNKEKIVKTFYSLTNPHF